METTTRTYDRLIRFVCEQPWAVLPSTLGLMQQLLRMRAAGFKFTAEELAERLGPPEARQGPTPREPGQIAVIPVWGLIGHRANELRDISSAVGTSTEVLGAQIQQAGADPAVTAVVLDVCSPGGGVFGATEVCTTIRSVREKKPIIAVCDALMASCAYWIGSSATEVVITPSGLIGAIGVYSIHEDHSKELADAGIAMSLISAGKYKFEDHPFGPLTDEARASIQERVDAYYALFTRDVAKGRGVSIDAVRNGFGEGRVVDAKQAVALGMADRIASLDEVIGDLVSKAPIMGSVESPRIAAEVEEIAEIQAETETIAPVHAEMPAREETADARARRLRLRLLELS